MKKFISSFILISLLILTFSLSASAKTIDTSNDKHMVDALVPQDSMYYNGHTYLAFGGRYTWNDAYQLCDLMGGHLVSLETADEQAAVMKLSVLGWTSACASGFGMTRDWIWENSRVKIGTMHEPDKGVKGDVFYYESKGQNTWDASTHEPNSWKSPWDQSVAELNKNGLNSLMPSALDSFICEFDKECVFSVVDLNYDMNFNLEKAWDKNNVWKEYPANYLNGIPHAIGWNGFGKTNVVPEYPNNTNEQYNFEGYSIKKDKKQVWLNNPYSLHQENSKLYLDDEVLDKPVVTLYAVWKRADTTPSDLECFAASMFAYSTVLEKGKTVSENLNLDKNLSWKDINNDLPRFNGQGHVTMRDFINATIGGYVVDDFKQNDNFNNNTFCALFLKNKNGQGMVVYRGTKLQRYRSVLTDIEMGFGHLNSQFAQAKQFYDNLKKEKKNPVIITGHSLGGSLAAHVGILNNKPCCTINSAQGFSIPISLLDKNKNTKKASDFISFATPLVIKFYTFNSKLDNGTTEDIEEFFSDPKTKNNVSFEESSAKIFKENDFDQYQPNLHSYAHASDIVSLPNRKLMTFRIYSGEKVNFITAHNIDRLIDYDENENRYSIVPTTLQQASVK